MGRNQRTSDEFWLRIKQWIRHSDIRRKRTRINFDSVIKNVGQHGWTQGKTLEITHAKSLKPLKVDLRDC